MKKFLLLPLLAATTLSLAGCPKGQISDEPVTASSDEVTALTSLDGGKITDVVFALQTLAEKRAAKGHPVDSQKLAEALDQKVELNCRAICSIKERIQK